MTHASPFSTRLGRPTPRYTSYPTALHFSEAVGAEQTADWLAALPDNAALSLYVHIPFCGALCWYCGCATMVVNRHDPIDSYMKSLSREIQAVADRLGHRRRVTHLHWGGGSPNSLTPGETRELTGQIRHLFEVTPDAEFAVEVDPRFMDVERAQALGQVGVNRVSIGVQDFNPEVQAAINRHQPFDLTRRVVEDLRNAGIAAMNIDLVYGLPHQTLARLAHTLDLALSLRPERLAVFGYAHLPERIRHQRLISTAALPGPQERMEQADMVGRRLIEAGYLRVGLDHFVLPQDSLARRSVHRNFQGYTVDQSDALIGFGASAISRLPQGYAQNAIRVADYQRRISVDGLATSRGLVMTADDKMRAHVIERLMCDLDFSESDLEVRFGSHAEPLIEIARNLGDLIDEGVIVRTPGGFQVTEAARLLVREVCARFDAFSVGDPGLHAPSV